MEFLSARQILPANLEEVNYDLFILASGYEARSIFLPRNFKIQADKKIAFGFEEKTSELNRKSNNQYLISEGFEMVNCSGEEALDLEPIISNILSEKANEHLNILVDYSSMTKVWYSGIINYLIQLSKGEKVTIHFSYTPASYNEPKKSAPVKVNKVVSYPFKKSTNTGKPTALILGLGLDKNRAEFIYKTLKPDKTFLLYADPAMDLKYVERVFKYNQDLIEEIEVRNLVPYPLQDLDKLDEILTNLCLNLRLKYNIVIVPLGPKVSSLISLLIASRFPDINVIRLSPGPKAPVFERIPQGNPLIYEVEFVSDDSDY
ncbi:MAG: hypothetical protein H6540_03125 [Bacteroidales bacterium]|nr:hypothetical protein [Bacteroidales bacterium]MCB9013860.1 hypothetical protein [Bacteroidales bacterium]